MDRTLASTRLYSVAPPDNRPGPHHPFGRHVRPSADRSEPSPAKLLLLSLGAWAAVWATLASVSLWLR